MAPALFLKAYLESTTEEYRISEEAPKIDAKNPAGRVLNALTISQNWPAGLVVLNMK